MANRWTLNEEHLNVDKYLRACANLYGYVTPRQFLKLYNRYNEKKINREKYLLWLEKLQNHSYLHYTIYSNAIVCARVCRDFFGIDISLKTVKRAKENLKAHGNVTLICGDFMSCEFGRKFNVIYSSLTFMHIKDKQAAINKIKSLLNSGGRFVLSIDKNQSDVIEYGTRKIRIYPDRKENIAEYIKQSGMNLIKVFETEFAHIFISVNHLTRT